ncbi:uncharacterized protein N7459_000821 [Penicillium hispanicum]|uniref:uncharacterized protein n=1 Tax=Penicillium hispanicum TaxID=1080232 RepID=UPI002540E61F|nr:uncharacterized protein N7459_000821 [Penicillium hispanicum]KAJ5594613.1 hypothetical protein N7459_000821 [Penicillium hispanicum]
MKTAAITTALLAAASTAFAAPSDFKRVPKKLELFQLSGALLTESKPTYLVQFTLSDPITRNVTHCNARWAQGIARTTKFNCTDHDHQVSFPSGISNIHGFNMSVSRPDGSEKGQNVVSGDGWVCKDVQESYLETFCNWDGVFDIEISKAS